MKKGRLVLVGIKDLNRYSSQQFIGLSMMLTSPELAVSVKEISDKTDISDLSIEEAIATTVPDEKHLSGPVSPLSILLFDPSRNPVLILQEKFSNSLPGCSPSSPVKFHFSGQNHISKPMREEILPMSAESFLEFSKDEKPILRNRSRLIPANHSRRQFQKCRR